MNLMLMILTIKRKIIKATKKEKLVKNKNSLKDKSILKDKTFP